MKSPYSAPKLVVYGSVEKITHALGNLSSADFFIIAGTVVPEDPSDPNSDPLTDTGSRNFIF